MRGPKGSYPESYRPPIRRIRQRAHSGSGTCMHLERNQEGILYFRQPMGLEDFVTWHIYPTGEAILRRDDIHEGRCLPPVLYSELRLGGHLYTNRSGTYIPPFPREAREAIPGRPLRAPAPSPTLIRRTTPSSESDVKRRGCLGWLLLFIGCIGMVLIGLVTIQRSHAWRCRHGSLRMRITSSAP
jgi:hypothetical protein